MAEASRLLAAVLSVSGRRILGRGSRHRRYLRRILEAIPSYLLKTAFMSSPNQSELAGEGTISETALWRAPRIFVLQTGLWRCQPQEHTVRVMMSHVCTCYTHIHTQFFHSRPLSELDNTQLIHNKWYKKQLYKTFWYFGQLQLRGFVCRQDLLTKWHSASKFRLLHSYVLCNQCRFQFIQLLLQKTRSTKKCSSLKFKGIKSHSCWSFLLRHPCESPMTVPRSDFERSFFVRLAVRQRLKPGETIAVCVAAGRRLGFRWFGPKKSWPCFAMLKLVC